MSDAILSIVSSALSILASLIGNAILSKWVGAVLFWLRQKADPQILAAAEERYNILRVQWQALTDARNNLPPSSSDPSELDDKK